MSSHSKDNPKDKILRVLSSAPGRYFTVQDLVTVTGVKEGTIQSVLSRHSELFAKQDAQKTGQGKRRQEYAWLLPDPTVPGPPLANNAVEHCENYPGRWEPDQVRDTPLTVILGGPKSGKTTLLNRIATTLCRPEDGIRHAHRVIRVNFASLQTGLDFAENPTFPRTILSDYLLARVHELMVPRLVVHYLFIEADREGVEQLVSRLMEQPALSGVQFTEIQSVLDIPPAPIAGVPACLLVFHSVNLLQYMTEKAERKSRLKKLVEDKPAVELSLHETPTHSQLSESVVLRPSETGRICRAVTAHTAPGAGPPPSSDDTAAAIAAALQEYQVKFTADNQPVLLALDGVDALYFQLRRSVTVEKFDNALLHLGMTLQSLEHSLTEQMIQDMQMVVTMGIFSRASTYSRPLISQAAVQPLQQLSRLQTERHFVNGYGLAAEAAAGSLAERMAGITSGQPYLTHNVAHLLRIGKVSVETLDLTAVLAEDSRPFFTCAGETADFLRAAHKLIAKRFKLPPAAAKTAWELLAENVAKGKSDNYHADHLSLIGCGLLSNKPTEWHTLVAKALKHLPLDETS
jgi:hypothetical protein